MSIRKPFTSNIHTIGFSSIMLGNVHRWSNWRILSIFRISCDLPWPVLSATPKALSICGKFQVRLLTSVVQVIDPANSPHDSASPCFQFSLKKRRGTFSSQGRRQLAAHFGVFVVQMIFAECVGHLDDQIRELPWRSTERSLTSRTSVFVCVLGFFGGNSPSGSDVMIPNASFASLYSSLSLRLTPPPKVMLWPDSRPS